MSGVVERPVSPETLLLEAASFEFIDIDEDISSSRNLKLCEQIAEAAKQMHQPGLFLARVFLDTPSDYETCQKIADIAKSIFFPSIERLALPQSHQLSILSGAAERPPLGEGESAPSQGEVLQQQPSLLEEDTLYDEAQIFVCEIEPYLTDRNKIKHPSFFQLLGALYNFLKQHKKSQEMYCKAATHWLETDHPMFAAESFAKAAGQILLTDPTNAKTQQEAAYWFEYAGDIHNAHGSEWQPVIACYEQAVDLYIAAGNYAKAGALLETMGNVYKPMPLLQENASLSFARASTYYGFAGDVQKQAESLEQSAIYARECGHASAADDYSKAGHLFAQIENDRAALRCFEQAASVYQNAEQQNECYKRAAFYCSKLKEYVQARHLYRKIPLHEGPIYVQYVVQAADQLAEWQQHKESAARFKEAAIYYEKNEEFLLAAGCFERVLEQRAKENKGPSHEDFELLGRIAGAYKQGRDYVSVLDCCKRGFLQRASPINWEKIVGDCLGLFAEQPLPSCSKQRTTATKCLIEMAEILKGRLCSPLAIKAYRLIAKWDTGDLEAAALFREAGKWFDSRREYPSALFCYKQAAERALRLGRDADAAKVFRDIGFLHQERGEFREAAAAYSAAAACSGAFSGDLLCSEPTLALLQQEAMELAAVDYAKAAKHYKQTDSREQARSCFASAAVLNRHLGCYQQAGECFKAAADLGLANSDDFYVQAAECYALASRVEDAILCYKKGSHLDPKRRPLSQMIDHVTKTILKLTTSKAKARCHEAIAAYCSEREEWPYAAKQWNEAGRLYAEEGASQEAAVQFQLAAEAYRKCSSYVAAAHAYVSAIDNSLEASCLAACSLGAAECYAEMAPPNYEMLVCYFFKAARLYAPIDTDLAIASLKRAVEYKPGSAALIRSHLEGLFSEPLDADLPALVPFFQVVVELFEQHGLFVKAMSLYGQILMSSEQLDDYPQKMEQCLLRCVDLAVEEVPGSIEELVEALVWAAKGFAQVKNPALAAKAYLLASKWALQEKRSDPEQAAAAYLREAIDLYEIIQDAASGLEASKELGRLYLRLGRELEAANVFTTMGRFYEELQFYELAAGSFVQAAELFKQFDQCDDQAASCYSQAARNWSSAENSHQAGSCYESSAQLSISTAPKQASACFDSAIEAFKKSGDEANKDRCCKQAASRFSRMGNGKEAVRYYKQVADSDLNTSIVYLEQAASSCSETEPALAASYWDASACKYAIREIYHRAAKAFELAAHAYRKSSSPLEAARAYLQARDYYLKDPNEKHSAAGCCRKAADCLIGAAQDSEFMSASDYYKQAGELYISIDVSLAIDCFESAISQDKSKKTSSIIKCFEEINKKPPRLKTFLQQAAELFRNRNDFVKAMGIYGLLLNQYGDRLRSEQKEEIRQQIEACLQECEKQTFEPPCGLVEAAVWAARAFENKSPAYEARGYRLAGIGAMKQSEEASAVDYLKKAIDLYETYKLVPSQLEASKRLADFYKQLGNCLEAALLFEKIGGVYENLKLHKEAADCFELARNCYKVAESTSQAVLCSRRAAANWGSLSRPDQVGNCLEQAGEWIASISGDEAISCFVAASEEFQKDGKTKRAERCFKQAAKVSSDLGREREALRFYSRIDPNSRVYDGLIHINYLSQAASRLQSLEEALSVSGYYSEISDVYRRIDKPGQTAMYHKMSAQSKEEWIRHKMDQLRAILLDPREYKSGYWNVQKWMEGLCSVGMVDEVLESMKKSSMQELTEHQLRHLLSNCHSKRVNQWLKDKLHKGTIEQVMEILVTKIKEARTPIPEPVEEPLNKQDDSESCVVESLISVLAID